MKQTLLLLTLGLVLSQTHLSADMIAATMYTTMPVSVGPDTGSGAATPVDFSSFNTSLGTLTEVIYTFSNVAVTGSDAITNNGGSSNSFTVNLNGNYSVADTNSNTVGITIVTTPDTQTLTAGQEHTFNASSTGQNPPAQTLIGTAGGGTANLSNYVGDGTSAVTVSLKSNSFWTVGTAASFNASPSSSATADISVEYIYTAVPEPSKTTACMIGLALCVLVGRNYFKGRGLRLA